jgi:hypothetical protein
MCQRHTILQVILVLRRGAAGLNFKIIFKLNVGAPLTRPRIAKV